MPGHIRDVVDSIGADSEILPLPATNKNLLNDCVRANIMHGIHQLKQQSSIIAEKIRNNELHLAGACYDLEKARVEWIK